MSDLVSSALKFVHLRTWYCSHFISVRISGLHSSREDRECNHLWVLIRKSNSDVKWNWAAVSANPLSTWEDLMSLPDKYWRYTGICANPNVSFDFLISGSFPDGAPIPLNWCQLLSRSDVSLHTLQSYIDSSVNAEKDGLIHEPRTLLSHSRLRMAVSENPNITVTFIKNNPHFRWDWLILSWSPAIPMQDIVSNPHLEWDWYVVSTRKLDTQIVVDNPNLSWDWETLSANRSINLDIVNKNRHLPWIASKLARNSSMQNKTCRTLGDRYVMNGIRSWRDAIHLIYRYPSLISEHTFSD